MSTEKPPVEPHPSSATVYGLEFGVLDNVVSRADNDAEQPAIGTSTTSRSSEGNHLMGLGLGIILIVAGAVLMWALNVDLSYVDDNTLGLILFIVGIITVVLSLVLNLQRNRTTHVEEHRYDR